MGPESIHTQLARIEERAEERHKVTTEAIKGLTATLATYQETMHRNCAEHWAVTRAVEAKVIVHQAQEEGKRQGLSIGSKLFLGGCTAVSTTAAALAGLHWLGVL